MKRAKTLLMGEAPFVFSKRTSVSLMWGTSAALLPALAWGILCFGMAAVVPVAASIVGAFVAEAIASGLRRRFTLWDGSAFLTGLLVGMAMPAGISAYVPAIASFFAIAVVKGAFGGLGSNWMNPALAGIAFALLNWPGQMSAWTLPPRLAGLSGISGATPLGFVRSHIALSGSGPMAVLGAGGFNSSGLDSSITEALNRAVFVPLGAELPSGYIDLFIGNKAGALGELSAILILAASIVLVSRKMIRWEIPASIVASFSILTWALGGLPGNGLFAGDVLFSVLSGSFLIVAFFMSTDPVTSPSSRPGMLVYGIGIGSLSFLFRAFGALPEGCAFAVILMNCAVPLLAKMDVAAFRRRAMKSAGMPG